MRKGGEYSFDAEADVAAAAAFAAVFVCGGVSAAIVGVKITQLFAPEPDVADAAVQSSKRLVKTKRYLLLLFYLQNFLLKAKRKKRNLLEKHRNTDRS
jgi:hypothetical protein